MALNVNRFKFETSFRAKGYMQRRPEVHGQCSYQMLHSELHTIPLCTSPFKFVGHILVTDALVHHTYWTTPLISGRTLPSTSDEYRYHVDAHVTSTREKWITFSCMYPDPASNNPGGPGCMPIYLHDDHQLIAELLKNTNII